MSGSLPRVISKKELCYVLGCIVKGTQKVSHRQLNKYYLTEDFITNILDMSIDDFKKLKKIPPELTAKIYDHYKVEYEEYEEAFSPSK